MKLKMENFSLQERSKRHWDYKLSNTALKNLKRFPRHERDRIFLVLEDMKIHLFDGDLKRMQGEENLYRRRVGNYRIYFRPKFEIYIFEVPEITRKQSN